MIDVTISFVYATIGQVSQEEYTKILQVTSAIERENRPFRLSPANLTTPPATPATDTDGAPARRVPTITVGGADEADVRTGDGGGGGGGRVSAASASPTTPLKLAAARMADTFRLSGLDEVDADVDSEASADETAAPAAADDDDDVIGGGNRYSSGDQSGAGVDGHRLDPVRDVIVEDEAAEQDAEDNDRDDGNRDGDGGGGDGDGDGDGGTGLKDSMATTSFSAPDGHMHYPQQKQQHGCLLDPAEVAVELHVLCCTANIGNAMVTKARSKLRPHRRLKNYRES